MQDSPAPCNAFISFTETHSATTDSMLSICDLGPGLWRLLIFVFVWRPEPLCRGRLVPPRSFYFSSIFHRGLCPSLVSSNLIWALSSWAVDALVPCRKLRCIPREHGPASVPLRSFSAGLCRGCVAYLFNQVSCFVLLFSSLSKLSTQVSDHSSLSSCSLCTAASTILNNSVSLFVLSLQLLFQVFDFFSFTAVSSASIFCKDFSPLSLRLRDIPRANSDNRHARPAVAIWTLFLRTTLCPSIFRASRSWHISRVLLSF